MKRFLVEYNIINEITNKKQDFLHIVIGHNKKYYIKLAKKINAKDFKIIELKENKYE